MNISLFKKQIKSYVGMELSSHQLRMIELSGDKDNQVINRYAIVDIPTEIYSNHAVHDQTKLGGFISKIYSQYGFSQKNIALALPPTMIITKDFDMPDSLSNDEQMDLVIQEVQNTVPLDIDEIYIDYKVLDNSRVDGTKESYFAVSKKEHVDDRVGALEIAGLNAKIVDGEHNALLYSVDQFIQTGGYNEDINILIVHISLERTEYLIYRNSKFIWSREHHLNAKNLIDSITGLYGVDFNEARQMALFPDNYSENYPRLEADTIQPFIDSISLEINRHIEMFSESGISLGVDFILLDGELISLSNLDSTISAQTNIEVVSLNALSHCTLSSKINSDELINDFSLLTVSMGMALRTF